MSDRSLNALPCISYRSSTGVVVARNEMGDTNRVVSRNSETGRGPRGASSATFGRRGLLLRFLVLLAMCCWQQTAFAHPFHISIGEMEWNATSQKWEVSVRLQSTDLQQAVRRFSKTQVAVDNDHIPAELIKYLGENFYLSNSSRFAPKAGERSLNEKANLTEGGQRSELKWVGHEVERGWMWLYFELTPPKQTENETYLTNSLLVEVVDSQTNTMLVRLGDKRHSVQTTARAKTEKLPQSVLP
jgi:hypothetical protein